MKLVSRILLAIAAFFCVITAFTRFLLAEWNLPSFFFGAGALVVLVIAVALDRKSFWQMLTMSSTRRWASMGITILLTVAFLVAFNYGVSFLSWKMDFTKEKTHTLSKFSLDVAKSFQQPVEFLYLQIPDENSKTADEAARLSLQKYVDANVRFKYTKLNIMEHPELAKKYNLRDKEQAMFVVIKDPTQDRHERFYKTDENSVTQALLRLLKGRKTLYFSVGHNELTLENSNPRGISSLKNEVERLFYDTEELNLEKEIVPSQAAALIIMGPEKNMSESFRKKIYDYFMQGGRIFIAFDPVQNPDESQFLSAYGVSMSSGIVHQEQNAMANLGSFVVAGALPPEAKHSALQNLDPQSPVMFYVTGALSQVLPSDFQFTPLLVSAQDSALRQGYSKQDKELGRGSYVLFAAVENKQGGVLLVSGDSDLFANQFLYNQQNSSFMFNVFSFLTKDQDVVKNPSLQEVAEDFMVTDTNFKLYIGLFAIPLPLFFLSFSGIWWFRRRWL